MESKNNNLAVRIVTSAVLLPFGAFVVHQGVLWSALLFAVAAGISAGEYYAIAMGRLSAAAWVGMGVSFLMPTLPILFLRKWPALEVAPLTGEACFWVCATFLVFAWTYHLFDNETAQAPLRSAHLVWGAIYAGGGLTALSLLRTAPSGAQWIFAIATVTWGNDTMAYFSGRLFGRHKLYPKVSPNKTWEGFAGGFVGSVAGLLIFRFVAATPLTLADCCILGIGGGLWGPIGDLCESKLKRAYGVKDSGKIIPGHGGLLDRIDALLFNAPMAFMYVHWVRGLI